MKVICFVRVRIGSPWLASNADKKLMFFFYCCNSNVRLLQATKFLINTNTFILSKRVT